jgi:hypothetical protein
MAGATPPVANAEILGKPGVRTAHSSSCEDASPVSRAYSSVGLASDLNVVELGLKESVAKE